MRICVYEDLNVGNLEPLVLCRPAFDLWCGASSLLDRQRRYFAAGSVAAVVRPFLTEYAAALHPELAVNSPEWFRNGVQALVNARWLPLAGPMAAPNDPHIGLVRDQIAYVALPAFEPADCTPETIVDHVESCRQTLPCRQVGGHMIDYPWELIQHNGQALEQDYRQRRGNGVRTAGISVVGPSEGLLVEDGARVDPFVVADTTKGPVIIDRGAVVRSFSILAGPCYIGTESWILGAKVNGSTIGPVCRVGGEVEESIIQGFSNKAHEGFLGHSYLGEWVNFGAGTQTSDLRNDYGPVSVVIGGRSVNTERTKVGSIVGDHTKTGLNTLLNTGSVIGPFCNLLASSSFCPKVVPSFCSFWHGRLQDRTDFRQLFTTAATVMGRRNREWTPSHAEFYLALYEATAAERRQVLRENEQRRLRRIV